MMDSEVGAKSTWRAGSPERLVVFIPVPGGPNGCRARLAARNSRETARDFGRVPHVCLDWYGTRKAKR